MNDSTGADQAPFEGLASSLPSYAVDLKLNLSSCLRQTELTPSQLWGTVVSVAFVCGNAAFLRQAVKEAESRVGPEVLNGAKAAGSIMAMNNVYYRFHHLTTNEHYKSLPARLRMSIIRSHGASPVDFELWSLAVSAIHACATCVESHERVLREKGCSEETIAAAVRLASVIHAVAKTLSAEEALAG
jgi:alkyl hydroperoxide reductase subunit D